MTQPTTNLEEWEREFDHWFNHGTKAEPRFAYANKVYSEVKDFLRSELKKAREETINELAKLKGVGPKTIKTMLDCLHPKKDET